MLAENILTANIPYYESYSDRTLNGNTIYVNNYKYSNIRAYLNGTANQFILDSGTATDGDYDWTDKGFLQTAFTTSLQEKIQTTIVDNSAASTNPASNESLWDNGNNGFACDDTSDKIFLLSEKEVTTSDYGFAEYNEYGFLSGRWRIATDYAKINGAITDTDDCGYWFLRTPHFDNFGCVLMVDSGGGVVDGNDTAYDCGVSFIDRGVVPALWVIP